MKQILIALIFAPSMLAAKAASPMAAAAPIEMAAFRLDEEPSEALPQSCLEALKVQANTHIYNLIQQLSHATQAYTSGEGEAAKKVEAEINAAKITVVTFWESGWRPEASQLAELSKAVTNFNAAQKAEIKRRNSLAAVQQSPKNHSTK
jgi:hypothetical protein